MEEELFSLHNNTKKECEVVRIVIKSDQLSVEIGNPGAYNGTRFDWTGFIHQVTLASGNHTFCAPESLIANQGTGGIGLCNEFGIHTPIGYEDIVVGDSFPKVGVGLLRRTDEEPYNFFRSYPVQPFPVQVEQGSDNVRFVSESIPHNGYAFKLEKELLVQGATLTINYALHNVGEKPVVTNEYVHNFLSIDEQPIGPDYVLHFPEHVNPLQDMSEYTQETLRFEGQDIGWNKQVEGMFYCTVPKFNADVPYYWELTHKHAGAGLRERGSATAAFIALWGVGHVLSPEVFVDISVNPGETQRWSRSYDFFTL
jgi:hypothetical protein